MRIGEINYFLFSTPFQLIKQFIGEKIRCLFHPKASSYANQDVLLVLKASDDENGALSLSKPFQNYAMSNHGKVKVVKKTVSSIQDIVLEIDELDKQNARIIGVWINAHSGKNYIVLGKDTGQTDNHIIANAKIGKKEDVANRPIMPNVDQLREALNKIKKNGVIVLDSCETGRIDISGKPSIAQSIADLAPGKIVYAATQPISSLSAQINWKTDSASDLKRLEVNFTDAKQSFRSGFLGCILNINFFCLYLLGILKVDITAKFKKYEGSSPSS